MFVEFKEVTGSLNKVGKRFSQALKQANNVFIKICFPIEMKDVKAKLKGTVKTLLQNGICVRQGKVFIWLDCNKTMKQYDILDLKQKAK